MTRKSTLIFFVLSMLASLVAVMTPALVAANTAQEAAANAANSNLVLLRAAQFDPVARIPEDHSLGLSAWRELNKGDVLGIVQFDAPPTARSRGALEGFGIAVIYYIPNNAYLVRFDLAKQNHIAQLDGVRAVFRLPKWARVDPSVSVAPVDSQGMVALEVIAVPGLDAFGINGWITKKFPAAIIDTGAYHHRSGRLIVRIDSAELSAFLDVVAGLEDVVSIMPWYAKQLFNDNSIWVGQSYDTSNTTNYAISATIWNQGILGQDQIVCVNDSGLDSDMCFFRYDATVGSKAVAQFLTPPDTGTIDALDKVIAYYVQPGADEYDTSSASFHGTHVTGSVAGDDFANLAVSGANPGHDLGDGMAPMAQIVMQDVGNSSGSLAGLAGDLTDMFQQAYDAGARIHSDSWGTTESAYDATAMDMDEFMFRNEDFLFVVAMGNSGTSPGDGSIGSPATAKGIVSVGATTNGAASSRADNLMAYSRGPVDDGRRKPDIVSPGSSINSAAGTASNTDNNCNDTTMSGTSMATPTTSGYLALLRQYYTDGFYPSGTAFPADARTPSGALMKATLINGAMPLGGTDSTTGSPVSSIPSMDQGWGRTHLDNALYFTGDSRRLRVWDVRHNSGLATGEHHEYSLDVQNTSEPLNVHLVWSDPESSTLASVNLVNNLDLEVVGPSSTTYLGNVFSGGSSTTGGTADVLNPVEGVIIPSPAAGTWTIRIKGTNVPGAASALYSDRQGYAVVATFGDCASGLAAPTGLNAVNNPPGGIDLSWAGTAAGYLIYRALGSTPAPDAYTLVGTSATNSFTDSHVQGGFIYSYIVRATDDCGESSASLSSSVTYTGNCALLPDFGGVEAVTNDGVSLLCDITIDWTQGLSSCPAGPGVVHNIYRSTDPYFTPSPSNLRNSTAGLSYTDYDVAPYVTYYYVVRAEDSTTANGGPVNGGNEEQNTKVLAATPWSDTRVPGTFTDDGGDSNAKLILTGEWRVSNQENHSSGGSLSYHNAPDGSNHGAGQCNAATTPILDLQSGAPLLSYWANYNIEEDWDGVVVEINDCYPTCDSGTWSPINPDSGYPGDFSQTGTPAGNACGYPSTQGCFNGPAGNAALTGWAEFTHDLTAFAGQTVQIRWNFSSDGGAEFEGFYLDDVSITLASVNQDCSTKNGQVNLDQASYHCDGDTITITLGDSDLTSSGSHNVTISSDSEPGGEVVTLNEAPADTGGFTGTIVTSGQPASGDGLLSVADGDMILVTYIDADDGLGGSDVVKTVSAVTDCAIPIISNVQVANLAATSASIMWDTDEVADSLVTSGLMSSPPPTLETANASFVTSHQVNLGGFAECTNYSFFVTSVDPAGNSATDDNSGAYFNFRTPIANTPTYSSIDTPLPITDSTTFTSTLVVADVKTVLDINVQIDITHTFDGDLDIFLISPNGTRVELATDVGSSGDNFQGTVFDDEAATPITSGSAPFAGTYQPEGNLSLLDGEASNGEWQLEITDGAGGDTGTLNWWKLTLEFPVQSCGPDAGYSTHSLVADTCAAGGSGNADGMWDPGDEVQFSLDLRNTGTEALTGVSITITPVTPGVSMTDAQANFPAIIVSGSAQSLAPHITAVMPTNINCGDTVDFLVDIVTDQGTFQDNFSQTIGNLVGGEITLVAEDFDGSWGTFGDNPPAGWVIEDLGDETTPLWNNNDWHKFAKGAPWNNVARVYYSPVENQDERLITPLFDIPADATAMSLEFDHYFNYYSAGDVAHVEINSVELGVWTSLQSYTADTANMAHESISLMPYIGQTNVQVRFRYLGNNGWYWELDNIEISGTRLPDCYSTTCGGTQPVPIFADGFETGDTTAWSSES